MQDNQNGIKVVDQVLLLKNLNSTGDAIVAQSVDSDESILYSDASGVLRYKNSNGDVSLQTSSSYIATVTESGTSRTISLSDAGKYIRLTNASACAITVPPQSSVVWLADTEIYFMVAGTGIPTITEGSGVTVNNKSATLAQYNSFCLKRVALNTWDLI